MRRIPIALLLTALLAGTAACGSDDQTPTTAPPASTTATAPAAAPTTAAAPRVTDLMNTIGCKGKVIGTQLYSRETGRCTIGTAEITIATFASADLRDQWVEAGREFGGNIATGDGWAAWCTSPDTAQAVADKLHGTVL